METAILHKLGISLTGMLTLIAVSAEADTFGNGANAFTIDFVNIGNPGNQVIGGHLSATDTTPRGSVTCPIITAWRLPRFHRFGSTRQRTSE